MQHYEERLRHYGIDYYLVGGHAFYAQQEIYDVVNLLRALNSPADAISLAGVLRCPMFSLTDETLFWLSQHKDGLVGGLFADPPVQIHDDEQKRRVELAANTLNDLRRLKDRLPVAALLNRAFELTGYDAALLAEFMGQRKLANLRKLVDQARAFDQSGVMGLADFIVQLSQFVVEQPREPLAATNPEGTDVVRLMTIHQAKGLEFPVVFVADIGRQVQHRDNAAVWHPELGPLVKVSRRGEKAAAISGLDLHQATSAAEDRAERLRLFYVATTRAADYLVLSGGIFDSDFESPSAPWLKLLAERFDLRTGRCSAVLPSDDAFQIPEVKVTAELPAVASAAAESAQCDLAQAVDGVLSVVRQLHDSKPESQRRRILSDPVGIDFAARRRFSVSRLNGELEIVEETATTPAAFGDEQPAVVAPEDFGTLRARSVGAARFSQARYT